MSYEYKNFSELDFESIKTSLKQYLSTQEAFVGFDFEGTAINAIVNLLAYNTQYNGFYLNMHASERFLSTAQRRENVVAIAKNLGYTPHSPKGGVTTLDLVMTPSLTENAPAAITVPKYTVFKCSTDDETFTLYTEESYTFSLQNITPTNPPGQPAVFRYVGTVGVFEGKKFTQNFIISLDQNGVVLSNKDVQTDKLLVVVTDGSTSSEWTQVSDISQLTKDSNVFFIEEVVGQKTRIYFGDNVIGKRPNNGSSVSITYFTTKGSLANGAADISVSDSIPGTSEIIISNSTTAKVQSGVDIESIDSIRANAPLLFASQNRAVTTNDFKTLIQSKILPGVHSISCWGGEEDVWSYIDVQSTPYAQQYVGQPKLGYVFISILDEPNDPTPFTSLETKTYVQNTLRQKYGVVTIFPEVVDPKITFLSISTVVRFDSTKNINQLDLKQKIQEAIVADQVANYSAFQTTLRYSKLSTAIDSASPYIISNSLDVSVYTEVKSVQELQSQGGVSIGIPIAVWSLESSEFDWTASIPGMPSPVKVFLTDSLIPGNSVALRYRSGNNVITVPGKGSVATIDRTTGTLTFNQTMTFSDIDPDSITIDNPLEFYAKSSEKDVSFVRNIAPILRLSDIQVELTAE